jgi:hypothetical protein
MFRGYLLSSFMFLYSMFFIKKKIFLYKFHCLESEKKSVEIPDVEEEDWGQFIDIEICCQ